jgi:2-hydroxychromene-2-carboxylate isomerase
MSTTQTTESARGKVGLWLDPVCPFSWNTARWLVAVAEDAGFDIEWHLMSLAQLNEGRELPPAQQARMDDSRRIGRLMAAVLAELGARSLQSAYFAFAERYFEDGADVDDQLAAQVLDAAGAHTTTIASMTDNRLDDVVRQLHQASQDALGEAGGSPMVTIDGHTFFGPVLTSLPERAAGRALFDAVAVVAATPEFSQLQRPRAHA